MKSKSKKSSTLLGEFAHNMESAWNIKMCSAGASSSQSQVVVRKFETESQLGKYRPSASGLMTIRPARWCRSRACEVVKEPMFSEVV